MKRMLAFVCVLLLAPMATAGNGAQHSEWSDGGVIYIPCLDTEVAFTMTGRGVLQWFNDANGGLHISWHVRWVGLYTAIGSDMTWTSRGGGPIIQAGNGNNLQHRLTWRRHEVLVADGDYPNLFWGFTYNWTFNANGDLVSTKMTDEEYRCLSD